MDDFAEHARDFHVHARKLNELFDRDKPNWKLATNWYFAAKEFDIRFVLAAEYAFREWHTPERQLWEDLTSWRERMQKYWEENLLDENDWEYFYDGFLSRNHGHMADALVPISLANNWDILQEGEYERVTRLFVDLWENAKSTSDSIGDGIEATSDALESVGSAVDSVKQTASVAADKIKEFNSEDPTGIKRVALFGGLGGAAILIARKIFS